MEPPAARHRAAVDVKQPLPTAVLILLALGALGLIVIIVGVALKVLS